MASLPSGSRYLVFADGLEIYYLTTETDGVYDTQIFSIDGTTDGAELLIDIPDGGPAGALDYSAGTSAALFYVQLAGGLGQTAIYGTDGTPSGTDLLFSTQMATAVPLTAVGSEMFFTTTTHTTATYSVPGQTEPGSYNIYTATLYESNGTPGGTHELATVTYGTATDSSGGIAFLSSVGGQEFFTLTSASGVNL